MKTEKILEKIDKQQNGCWIWTGSKTNTGTKYGRINKTPAHRVVYEIYTSTIPVGLELDHLCRITLCVNPEHLEPVTKSENVKRLHKFQREQREQRNRIREISLLLL